MNALTIAVTSYIIAIIIAFFVAGIIQLMGTVLSRFTISKETANTVAAGEETPGESSEDTAIAAVIVIAKNH